MYNPGSDNYSESRIIADDADLNVYRRLFAILTPQWVSFTLDPQPISRWQHSLEPVRMGETRYEPIQCFAIKDYYRHGKRYDRLLTLPPLANPWTGKPMQKTLFDTE